MGYSGGADSTALVHLLHSIGVDIVAAHLHHGMRDEADEEMRRCAEFCDSLGVPIVTGRADVPRMAKELGVGIEEAGREARYNFFRQAAFQTECDWVATGHTQDDHIETVLFHMARGTGLAGLAGIPEVREGIIRPLLPFTRAELREYCETNNFWFHDDPANSEIDLSRVRLRERVIPEFEKVHPGFRAGILRLSESAQEDEAFLNGLAAQILERAEIQLNGSLNFITRDCEMAFSRAELAHAPDVLRRRALRLAVQYLGGKLSYDQADTWSSEILGRDNSSFTSDQPSVILEIKEDSLTLRQAAIDQPFRFHLTIPGETESEVFGWKLVAQDWDVEDYKRIPASLDAVIDREKTKGELFFRSVQDGDKILPLGGTGHKKIADIYQEMGLTLAARRRLPIICDMVGPIWIPGGRMDDRVKITPQTNRALRLSFEPLHPVQKS
ncbi:MAG: tRNA lysidine(34) synthetase TilS [Armatimonadetes bacterium]|nr:tRNA lysidine(34) synthetase TilS [Armatimonadota bacterium]